MTFSKITSFINIPYQLIAANFLASLVIVFLTLVVRAFLFQIIRTSIEKVEDEDVERVSALEARAQTLGGIARSAVSLAVFVVSLLMILSEWGIDITPLIASAGILGLGIGFGTQTLVKDMVTGFFILLENQFNVGDKIKIAGYTGVVQQINLRTTVLLGEDGQIHVIPNSKVSDITRF